MLKNSIPYILFCTIILCISSSCTIQKKTNTIDPVIASVGNNLLHVSDFKYVYEKSRGSQVDSMYTYVSLEDYLGLYINYKLKIIDAESEGLDKKVDFLRELETYREQLAKPYLTDQEKIDQLVKEAYDRLKEEVNVSHILITVPEEAEPQDTLLAYERILELRQQALDGKNFENLALSHSQDPSIKNNAGNLGWFSALQMLYSFENASYETGVGNISDLLRTRFGYHFLKVLDRRTTSGKVKVAHIMLRLPQGGTKEDSLNVVKKIEKIYEKLQSGEDWNRLCLQYSEDAGSKSKSGELPIFSIGTVIPAIENVAFGLQSIQEISKPFQTEFGWHILKLLEKRSLDSMEELEPFIRQKIASDSRYEVAQLSLIAKLQKINLLVVNAKNYEKAISRIDGSFLKGNWQYNTNDDILKLPLFSFESSALKIKKNFTVRDLFDYLVERQVPKPELKNPKTYFEILYNRFLENQTLAFERDLLEMKYPEFKLLLKEYKEGMLLFQVMNEKVWNKALTDSVNAKQFYEKNKDKYKWQSRANVSIYECANKEIYSILLPSLQQGLYPVNEPRIENIYFKKDDATLDSESLQYLNKLIAILTKDTSMVLEIAGHLDVGENTGISTQRARMVSNIFTSNGIDIQRLIIKDFGQTRPISKDEREKNRRTELKLFSSSTRELEKFINSENPLNLKITEGTFQKNQIAILSKIDWQTGEYILEENEKVTYVIVHQLQDPRPKNYEEAKGEVISDYQSYLEKEWLTKLKQQYPISINQAELQKLVKK